MTIHLLRLACACFLLFSTSRGEEEEAELPQHPKSWQYYREQHPDVSDPPVLSFGQVDADHFRASSGASLGRHLRNIHAVAPKGFKEFDALEEGEWLELPEGGWIWRLVLQSPGAPHQVALFSDIRIPLRGELFIYAPAWTRGFQECEQYCYRYGTFDVPHIHKLTTPSMPGDEIWLEYYQPHSPEQYGEDGLPSLLVASVMQGINRDPDGTAAAADDAVGGDSMGSSGAVFPAPRRLQEAPAPAGTAKIQLYTQFVREVPDLQQTEDKTGLCTNSILCDPDYEKEKQGVMSIYAINLDRSNPEAFGTIGLCTGTLVSAPSGALYVITADHCFADKKAIDNFQYWMLIFNYEVECKGTVAPPFKQMLQGVRLLFYDSDSDVLLLQLPSSIPTNFLPYLMGWDARPEAVPEAAVAIHHPAGSVKRISYTNGTGAILTQFPQPEFQEREIQPTQDTHMAVLWSFGSTEGGSSGSPLIDTTTRRIVGVLSGGFASCSNPTGRDYYGRLSSAWDKGLANFLQEINLDTGGAISFGNASTSSILAPGYEDIAQKLVSNIKSDNETALQAPFRTARVFSSPGPGIGFFPSTLVLTTDGDATANITTFLSEAPQPGETIKAAITLETSGGVSDRNAPNATDLVTIKPSAVYFTADNFSSKAVVTVTRRPGVQVTKLARFDILFALSSDKNATFSSLFGARGVVDSTFRNLSDFTPITIPRLPWKPSLSSIIVLLKQLHAAKNKGALFRFTPTIDVNVTLNVCWDKLAQATATVYKDKAIAWSLASRPPPAGSSTRCINLPNLRFLRGSTYDIVVSDDGFFNGVLPLEVLKGFALDHAKRAGINATDIARLMGAENASEAPAPATPEANRRLLARDMAASLSL